MPAPAARAITGSFVDLAAATLQKMLWRADKGYPHVGHLRGCRQILAGFPQPLQADWKKRSHLHAAGRTHLLLPGTQTSDSRCTLPLL